MNINQDYDKADSENYESITVAISHAYTLSRNKYATPEQKKAAVNLYHTLRDALETYLDETLDK